MTRVLLRGSICLVLTGSLAGCSAYKPFDSPAHVRQQASEVLAPEQAAGFQVPFELSPRILEVLDQRSKPSPRETERVEQVLSFIFEEVGLRYSLFPTRDANATFRTAEGNCLSFVNLFVGVARHYRLNPFYVEVRDLQRWRQQDGLVLSQGHIVAGMQVNGELRTFDFLPYQPKSYRNFNPIDDQTAAAHYYNNLAAESLMVGDLDTALHNAQVATALGPTFEKAWNNFGVVLARQGDLAAAEQAYRTGLESAPDDVAILTNMARLYQRQGDGQRAMQVLADIEASQTTNPYFYVFRAELALSKNEYDAALEYLRTALRLDSEVPEVHVGLAKLYLGLGKIEEAKHHVGRALRLDATHRDARRLAQILAGGQGDERSSRTEDGAHHGDDAQHRP